MAAPAQQSLDTALDLQEPTQLVEAAASQEALAPAEEAAAGPGEGLVVQTCFCRHCKVELPTKDAHKYPSVKNPSLLYSCKGCYSAHTNLKRHGVSVEDLCHGEALHSYFSKLRVEREQQEAADGRLSYGRLRAQLKQHLVTERITTFEASTEGEYQPLSYWELKGYDTGAIESNAPSRQHPVLGMTYRVAIDKDKEAEIVRETEKVLVDMESKLQQKKQKQLQPAEARKALQDAGVKQEPEALVDVSSDAGLSEAAEDEAPADNRGKKRKTEEEKQEAREEKKKAKRAEKQDRVELAAAAKLLPALKAAQEKLQKAWDKVSPELKEELPPATQEAAQTALQSLADVLAQAQARLQAAAKGKALTDAPESLWRSEKDLNQEIRAANAAVRSLQNFFREHRAAAPKAKGKAEAKGKAPGKRKGAAR